MATGKEKSWEVVLTMAGQISVATSLDTAYLSDTTEYPGAYKLNASSGEYDGAAGED